MVLPQTAKQSRSNGFWWNPPRPHWFNNIFLVHSISALVIFVDQLTKAFAFGSVGLVGSVVNHGVSFGLFSTQMNMWIAVIFPLILLLFLWSLLKKYPIILGLLQGGAVSNLLDRLLYGGVRDWLSVPVLGLRNNLADWAIVIALVWYGIMLKRLSKGCESSATNKKD